MKNNLFGYLFLIFIFLIMGFSIYKVGTDKAKKTAEEEKKVSVSSTKEKGTELTLGISEFDTINPIITKNKNVQNVTRLIYEPLFNITKDGKIEPSLASEWSLSDSRTYIIKIKTGIKWSDGTVFSSGDVKFTIDRLKDTNKDESTKSVYSDCVKYVKEVDIIDNETIRIILSKEVKMFQYYLYFPILSSNFYKEENFWDTKKNKAPITTGRFKISEVTGKTIVLTKNIYWWNKENEDSVIEKVNLNKYSSVGELYNAFKLGRIDLIATENTNYQQYIGTIGYNTTEIEGRRFVFLALNTQSRFLSDVNTRKALRAAINKSEINSKIYNKKYSIANFPLSTNSYLVKREDENFYNLESFRTFLNQAGWNQKNGLWQKIFNYKVVNLELKLVVRKKDSYRLATARYLKNKLAEQGIIVNVIEASNKQYRGFIDSKDYDMILCESTLPISPNILSYFGGNNLANFSNEESDEIINFINNITEEKELQDKYQKLYEIYNNEVPYIGIVRSKIAVITNSYLTGEINSRWYNLFFNFKDWYTS